MSFYCEWLQVTSGITTKRVRGGMSAQLGHWQDWMFVHFLLTVPLCNFLFLAPDLVLSPHCSSSVLFCFAHWHSAFPLSSHWAFPYSPATSFSCSSFSLPLQPPSHFPSFFKSGVLTSIWHQHLVKCFWWKHTLLCEPCHARISHSEQAEIKVWKKAWLI